jgi:uncharacterized protein (TIGR03067 family)
MRALLLLALVIALPPDRPDPTPKDKEKARPLAEQIQGEWQMTKAIRGGQAEQPEKVNGTAIVIKDTTLLVREAGRKRNEDARFTLDANKTPAAIDLMPVDPKDGNGRGITVEGIIKIEGDTLTLCFPHGGGGKRPTQFVSDRGSNLSLLEFRRVKK